MPALSDPIEPCLLLGLITAPYKKKTARVPEKLY
jgi:hypothetical protein